MPTQYEIQTALANEARRQELKTKVASLKGAMAATASAVARLSTLNSDSERQLTQLSAELAALEAGAGPGITADFGNKSTVTQFLETERAAAKEACIDYVKANPECTEDEAATAWNDGALAAHPGVLTIQDGLAMGRLYQQNLYAGGYIQSATWEDQRAWIIATPKEVIMSA